MTTKDINWMVTMTVATVVAHLAFGGKAAAFKGKNFPQCAELVNAADELVDRPSTFSKAKSGFGKATGMLGKFGGFGGSAGKAAQVANQVQQYEGYIESAAGLATSMLDSHPDPADRWSAYSGQMNKQGKQLYDARQAIAEAQNCYNTAYDDLAAQVADGSMKSRKAKKPLKEIKKGTKETGKLLDAVLQQARNNTNAYGEALGDETSGLDVGGFMSGQASYCANAAGQLANWCGKY
ncbi:MAG: hypothetical protein AAF607_11735, partial [Pseudomonadota bacterium]